MNVVLANHSLVWLCAKQHNEFSENAEAPEEKCETVGEARLSFFVQSYVLAGALSANHKEPFRATRGSETGFKKVEL